MSRLDKQAYLLHAKLLPYRRRVDGAIKTAQEAIAQSKNPVLSFSSGKDSVVLLDIALKAGFRGDLLFFKYGICVDVETPAENIQLLKYYAEKHGMNYHVLDCLGEVDCWEQCGRFTLFPRSQEEKRIFQQTNYDYAKRAEEFCKKNGIDLQLIGMRKKESPRREIILNKKGLVYQTRSRRSVTCCPIGNLRDEDIWAYIFSNDLRYLSIYDYPFIDRRKIRNEITLLYSDGLIAQGLMYHYKQMYPDYFAWLKGRWGDI